MERLSCSLRLWRSPPSHSRSRTTQTCNQQRRRPGSMVGCPCSLHGFAWVQALHATTEHSPPFCAVCSFPLIFTWGIAHLCLQSLLMQAFQAFSTATSCSYGTATQCWCAALLSGRAPHVQDIRTYALDMIHISAAACSTSCQNKISCCTVHTMYTFTLQSTTVGSSHCSQCHLLERYRHLPYNIMACYQLASGLHPCICSAKCAILNR